MNISKDLEKNWNNSARQSKDRREELYSKKYSR